MATLIDSASAASTDASNSTCTTASLNTTGATLLVAAVCGYDWDTRYASDAPTDSKGNTWTAVAARQESADNFAGVRMWYVNSATPTVGSGHTFTSGAIANASYPCLWVWAFDSTGAAPLRNASGNTATSSPTSIQPSAAVGANGDIVVTIVCDNLGTGTSQACNGSFLTAPGHSKYGFVGSTHGAGAATYKFTTGTEQPTWSSLTGTGAAVAIAAFQTTGGGAAGIVARTILINQAINRSNTY